MTLRPRAATAIGVDGITDGGGLVFRSVLNVQAVGAHRGATDSGITARCGVLLSEGLGFGSTHGAFLPLAAHLPEPGNGPLMRAGVAAIALRPPRVAQAAERRLVMALSMANPTANKAMLDGDDRSGVGCTWTCRPCATPTTTPL